MEPETLPGRFLSPSPETTEAVGEALGSALVPGSVVGLIGELGSGKTTFVRGLARGLGVTDAITSPTFTRMRELPGRLTLHHFDAWRGGSEELFREASELLAGEGVSVVEWADRVERWLPCPRIEVGLRHLGPVERGLEFAVHPGDPGAGRALRELEEALRAAVGRALRTKGLQGLEP